MKVSRCRSDNRVVDATCMLLTKLESGSLEYLNPVIKLYVLDRTWPLCYKSYTSDTELRNVTANVCLSGQQLQYSHDIATL